MVLTTTIVAPTPKVALGVKSKKIMERIEDTTIEREVTKTYTTRHGCVEVSCVGMVAAVQDNYHIL